MLIIKLNLLKIISKIRVTTQPKLLQLNRWWPQRSSFITATFNTCMDFFNNHGHLLIARHRRPTRADTIYCTLCGERAVFIVFMFIIRRRRHPPHFCCVVTLSNVPIYTYTLSCQRKRYNWRETTHRFADAQYTNNHPNRIHAIQLLWIVSMKKG